jgi:ferredoxin
MSFGNAMALTVAETYNTLLKALLGPHAVSSMADAEGLLLGGVTAGLLDHPQAEGGEVTLDLHGRPLILPLRKKTAQVDVAWSVKNTKDLIPNTLAAILWSMRKGRSGGVRLDALRAHQVLLLSVPSRDTLGALLREETFPADAFAQPEALVLAVAEFLEKSEGAPCAQPKALDAPPLVLRQFGQDRGAALRSFLNQGLGHLAAAQLSALRENLWQLSFGDTTEATPADVLIISQSRFFPITLLPEMVAPQGLVLFTESTLHSSLSADLLASLSEKGIQLFQGREASDQDLFQWLLSLLNRPELNAVFGSSRRPGSVVAIHALPANHFTALVPNLPSETGQTTLPKDHWRFFAGLAPSKRTPGLSAAFQAFESSFNADRHLPLALAEDRMVALGSLFDDAIERLKKEGTFLTILEEHRGALMASLHQWIQAEGTVQPLHAALKAVIKGFKERVSVSEAGQKHLDQEINDLFRALSEGLVLPLNEHTSLHLYLMAIKRQRSQSRQAFQRTLQETLTRLDQLLDLDEQYTQRTGNTASQFFGKFADTFNKERLDQVMSATRRGSKGLDERRKARVSQTRTLLNHALHHPLPEVLLVGEWPEGFKAPNEVKLIPHPEPLSVATGVFTAIASQAAALFKALRIAQLEINDSYDPDQHDDILQQFQWSSCSEEEKALFPTVALLSDVDKVKADHLGTFSRLLGSHLPLHLILRETINAQHARVPKAQIQKGNPQLKRDLGYLAIAHKDVFVTRSLVASGGHLWQSFQTLASDSQTAVAIVVEPDWQFPQHTWAQLQAFALGRATACYTYNPKAGPTWSSRFDLSATPHASSVWPSADLPLSEQGKTLPLAFTFADTATLLPYFETEFLPIEASEWSDQHLPLWTYLEDPSPSRKIPFIWTLDERGILQRTLVSRDLSEICRDRKTLIHTLQELGGIDNDYVRIATETVRKEEQLLAQSQQDALRSELEEEIERVRQHAAREGFERLARALAGMAPLALSEAPVERHTTEVSRSVNASVATVSAPAEVTLEAPAEALVEEVTEDPYVDSELCTSCNECVSINPLAFKYDGNKQVFLHDASAIKFAQLVQAAESCPARCIHPGQPRPGDATATPDWIKRAEVLQ